MTFKPQTTSLKVNFSHRKHSCSLISSYPRWVTLILQPESPFHCRQWTGTLWVQTGYSNAILLHQALLQGSLLKHISVKALKQQLINKKIIQLTFLWELRGTFLSNYMQFWHYFVGFGLWSVYKSILKTYCPHWNRSKRVYKTTRI